MPRTKKFKPQRVSSLVPGSSFNPKMSRYLEVLESELEETLQSSLAAERAATEQICRKVDMWYNNILRTVPMEVLLEPFKASDHECLKLPDIDAPSLAPTMASHSSCTASSSEEKPSLASAEEQPSTARQTRRRVGAAPSTKGKRVAVKKKLSPAGSCSAKPQKMARKVSSAAYSFRTPLARTRVARGSLPIVTPKFDIRKRPPATARAARQGETLLSLSGSPVASKPAGAVVPVHVHLNGGQVVKLKAESGSDESVKQLCRAIQQYCALKK